MIARTPRTLAGFARPAHPAAGPIESRLLSLIFLGMIVIYAALGRDVFSNSLVQGQNDDLVSTVLPYLRLLICGVALLVLVARVGVGWMAVRVPWLFLPYLGIALASVFWSLDPKVTIRNVAGLIALWLTVPLVVNRIGLQRAIRIILHVMAVTLILSVIVALLVPEIGRHTGLEVMQQSHIGRWRGIFGHKNSLGAWAALGSVFLFTQAGGTGVVGRLYWWSARLAALTCLAKAESVTAIVVAGVLLAVWLAFRIAQRVSPALAMVLNLMLAVLVGIVILGFSDLIFELLGRSAGLTGRPIIWAMAEHFFWLRPWLGSGFGTLGGPEFLEYILISVGQAIPGPESGYLVLLLETGIVGTACFLLAVIAAFRIGLSWLGQVDPADRRALEFAMMVVAGALVTGFAESRSFIYYGTDTIVFYCAFLSLLALPKASVAIRRFRPALAGDAPPSEPAKQQTQEAFE